MTEECPTCGDEFDSKRAMKVHHSRSHDQTLKERTECQECGEMFVIEDPTKPNKYCSPRCVSLSSRDRVELTCATCDKPFRVPKSASDRKFCSTDCIPDGTKLETCEMCDRGFRIQQSMEQRYCCRACRAEASTTRPRPADLEMLLWLLYVYEDHNVKKTYRRQRAILGADECLTQQATQDKLEEMGVFKSRIDTQLRAMSPDDIGSPLPEGDDTWKILQQQS